MGRRLWLQNLFLSRNYLGPQWEWELCRGFRVSIDSAFRLQLFLATPEQQCHRQDPDLLDMQPIEQEEQFTLVLDSPNLSVKKLQEELQEANSLGIVLILSPKSLTLLSLMRMRRALKCLPAIQSKAHCVFWVSQDMPTEPGPDALTYFNLEKNLIHFGRMGRHVKRHLRWLGWFDRI